VATPTPAPPLCQKTNVSCVPYPSRTIAIVLDGVPQSDEDILRHYAVTIENRKDVDGVERIAAGTNALFVKDQADRYVKTFRAAVARSGVGGTIVLAAGHGTHANQAFFAAKRKRDPFVHFDLVAGAQLQVDPEIFDPAIVAKDNYWAYFIDKDGSFKIPPPGTALTTLEAARRRLMVRGALREMRLALSNAHAKEVIVAACGVGADPKFVQHLADSLGTRVRATSHWVKVSLNNAQQSNPTNTSPSVLYRLDTETPIDTDSWNPVGGTNPVEVGPGLVFHGQISKPASTNP
jgi:hypothetical protein